MQKVEISQVVTKEIKVPISQQIENKFIETLDTQTLSKGFKMIKQVQYKDLFAQLEKENLNKTKFKDTFKPAVKTRILNKDSKLWALTNEFSPIDLLRTNWSPKQLLDAVFKAFGYKPNDTEEKVFEFLGKEFYDNFELFESFSEKTIERIIKFCPEFCNNENFKNVLLKDKIYQSAIEFSLAKIAKNDAELAIFESVPLESHTDKVTDRLKSLRSRKTRYAERHESLQALLKTDSDGNYVFSSEDISAEQSEQIEQINSEVQTA